MHPFIKQYEEIAIPRLKQENEYASTYLIPKVEKITINVGLGDVIANQGQIDQVLGLITKITGQKPVYTKATKAIAGFKIRQGMNVGLKVTLRGVRMYDFAAKLLQIALPRTRDFRGIPVSSINKDGSLHIGIKDSMIFPEVANENFSHPLQITFTVKNSDQKQSRVLFDALGVAFQEV